MARIAGVDLPREKRLEIALTYIYGVGRTRAAETLAATGVSPDVRVKDATEEDLVKLRDYIEANFKVEGDPAVRFRPTFVARLKSVRTRVFATVVACRSTVSAPRPTRVPARAPSAPLQARRRPSKA